MDISADTAKIIAEAHDWNFAGDCSLLELMRRISQNMSDRASNTLDLMSRFDLNVKRTAIALDNANNKLRALQFGQQFVEYRCQEDDEIIAFATEAPEVKTEESHKTKQDLLDNFLANNINMLRKNYEKYSIDIPDSDDDVDDEISTTCIYRPKNPYNKRPLPYLIGSKEWNEHWHVGLVDSSNEFSADEESEEFSESSSSTDVNERILQKDSYESANATNLSDWASSTSLNNENIKNLQNMSANSGVQSRLSHKLPTSAKPQAALTNPTAIDSDSSSSLPHVKAQPRNIISSARRNHEHDLIASLRQTPPSDDTPNVSSSSSSPILPHIASQRIVAPAGRNLDKQTSNNIEHNLFDDNDYIDANKLPTANQQQTVKPSKPSLSANTIKRKPVNLFDDEDFNSFLSEITNKVNTRTNMPTETKPKPKSKPSNCAPIPTARTAATMQSQSSVGDLFTSNKSNVIEEVKSQPTIKSTIRNVNLFDDSPPPSPTKSEAYQQTAETVKPTTTAADTLFNTDPKMYDDFLDTFDTPQKHAVPASNQKTITKISLFDDDDDDLDINDIFARKPPPVQRTPNRASTIVSTRATLFDDDVDDEGNEGDIDLFGNKRLTIANTSDTQKVEINQRANSSLKSFQVAFEKEPAASSTVVNNAEVQNLPQSEQSVQLIQNKTEEKKEEGDDSTAENKNEETTSIESHQKKPIEKQVEEILHEKKPTEPVNSVSDTIPPSSDVAEADVEPNITTKNSLFEAQDADDDDIFGTSIKPKLTKAAKEVAFEVAQKSPLRSTAEIFDDEILDNEDQLFPTESRNDVPHAVTLVEQIGKFEEQTDPKENNTTSEIEIDASAKVTPVSISGDEPQISITETISDTYETPEATNSTDAFKTSNLSTPNYSSLFMDEPPDDNEFFETLSGSQLANSKLFDVEHDFYEPALPQTPVNNNNNTKATNETTVSSDYGGLRLFSEVPPDDDDEAGTHFDKIETTKTAKPELNSRVETTAGGTTRLHTIFYDDFSETATSSIMKAPTTAGRTTAAVENPEPAADVVDRSAAVNTAGIVPKVEATTINKLKLPKIKINVQALLPNAGLKPKMNKSSDIEKIVDIEPRNIDCEPTAVASAVSVIATTKGHENLLSSMNKTRVRVPVRRRPSTRQGRQETYRKSLLDEEHEQHRHYKTQADASDNPVTVSMPTQAASVSTTPQANTSKSKLPATTTLLKDYFSDEDDSLFMPIATTKPKPALARINHIANKPFASAHKVTAASANVKAANSFLDSDDDLFAQANVVSSVAASNYQASNVLHQTAAPTTKALSKPSLFGSGDEDDDDDNFLRSLKRTQQKPKTFTAGHTKSLFSDEDSDADDDDLFGGGRRPARTGAPTKHSKQPAVPKEPPTSGTAALAASPATAADNPLADLLGSSN